MIRKISSSIHDFIRSLRYHSIFAKTLAVMTTMILCACVVFYIFINHVYQRDNQLRNQQEQMSLLNILNQELETNLLSLTVQAEDFLNENNTISLGLNGVTPENTEVLDVTLSLTKFVQDNDLALAAYLHVITGDTILTSDKKILTGEEWEQGELFLQTRDDSGLIQYQDQLYLLIDFPVERPLLEMAVKLDRKAMWESLRRELSDDHSIYMYYKESPVFYNLETYPSSEKMMVRDRKEIGEYSYMGISVGTGEEVFVLYPEHSNIRWVSFVSRADLLSGTENAGLSMLPVTLLLLLLLVAGSMVLVRLVYRPMERMLQTMIGSSEEVGKADRSTSELQQIERLYSEMEEQRDSMKHMLSNMGDAVYERLLTALLGGAEMKDEEYVGILRDMGGDHRAEGMFQVFVLNIFYGPERVCTLSEQEMHRWAVQRRCREFWKDKAELNILPGRDSSIVQVLSYPEGTTTADIKRFCSEMETALEASKKELKIEFAMGTGRVCGELRELHDAWQEADRDMQERLYYQRDSRSNPESLARYTGKAAEILQSEPTTAGMYAEKILLMLKEASEDAIHAPKIYAAVCDAILERMIQMNIDRQDSWMEIKHCLDVDQDPLEEDDVRIEQVRIFVTETTGLLEQAAGKEKFRYIENAKKYIEAHYNDNNLSLNVVSEYCGISSSYLSRLFTDYMAPGFVEYLNQYRVQQAESLILGTSYTIADIGFKTGFNSPQNFIRVFKKYRGETPGQYRARKGALS